MIAKLSALSLCTSFVSALQIMAPATAKVGGSAELHLVISAGDPTNIQLLLIRSDVKMVLATDEPVNATMYVAIPGQIPASSDYLIAAADPEDPSTIYAESDYIQIVDS